MTQEFEEASSEAAKLRSMLTAAQREMNDADTVRAGLLDQLSALRADAQALQESLSRTQHDRQQVSINCINTDICTRTACCKHHCMLCVVQSATLMTAMLLGMQLQQNLWGSHTKCANLLTSEPAWHALYN